MTRKEKKEFRSKISKKYNVKKVEIFKADNSVQAVNEEGKKVLLGYAKSL